MRLKTDQLADIDHLLSEMNSHAPALPHDSRPTWERLKQAVRAVLRIAGETMDEVVEDNIREDQALLDEAAQLREHAARQHAANQKT